MLISGEAKGKASSTLNFSVFSSGDSMRAATKSKSAWQQVWTLTGWPSNSNRLVDDAAPQIQNLSAIFQIVRSGG